MTKTSPWRLLQGPDSDGPTNMAVDEALLLSFAENLEALPVLRFYTWKPSTLSLGRFQNTYTGLDERILKSIPVVRRMTGGGAIWHAHELTYSLVCRQNHVGEKGVKASFEWLCQFLIEGYRALGINACFAKDSISDEAFGRPTPACFAAKEEYDIVIGNRKLGGNAQKRQKDIIFQHGSIPLLLNWTELNSIFEPQFRPDPLAVTSIVEENSGISLETLVAALSESFSRTTGAPLQSSSLSDAENQAVKDLVETKYSHDEWTWNAFGSMRA